MKPASPSPSALLRGVSQWSVEQAEAMPLPYFFDKDAKFSEKDVMDQVAALIWLHSLDTDEDQAEAAIANGTWKECVRKFKRNPASLSALPEVAGMIQHLNEIIKHMTALTKDAKPV